MSITYSKITLSYINGEIKPNAQSLLPHKPSVRNNTEGFYVNGHKTDTLSIAPKRMRPPSEPAINRDNPNMYFIYWNHDVPHVLWDKYGRKRIRIKKYDDINRYKGQEREDYAEKRRQVWKYDLEQLKHNPFEEDLMEFSYYQGLLNKKATLTDKLTAIKQEKDKAVELSDEAKRKLLPLDQAFNAFMQSRRERKLAPESISSYQGTIDWLYEGLSVLEYIHLSINELKHIHVSGALSYIAEDRDWQATTINKEIDFAMTVLNWLETEEYIDRNPSKGKFIKLPTNKSKHRWYDRETKTKVLDAVRLAGNTSLLRACQFTYELMIRSKKELRMLKIGDIDRTLKRIRYRADLSKNNTETYRDYNTAFEALLEEMELHKYPNHFFVFGSGDGTPGIKMVGHNYFSKMFMAVKTKLELSMDYTVYGFKHTRIVHELMKGTDGYEISHMARHTDRKSTKEYQRDYDITLVNVYKPEDLKF